MLGSPESSLSVIITILAIECLYLPRAVLKLSLTEDNFSTTTTRKPHAIQVELEKIKDIDF